MAQAVFLKVGTNDLTRQPFDPQASYSRYAMIVQRIQQESPSTVIVVQSLLPRAAAHRAEVEAFNQQIEQIAAAAGVTFVNLYPHFLADDGSIGDDLSNDELHLTGSGYRLWQEVLAPVLALQAQGQPASR